MRPVSLEKLGALLDNSDKEHLKYHSTIAPPLALLIDDREQLLTLIHKNNQIRWSSGPASSGIMTPAVPIDFYLENVRAHAVADDEHCDLALLTSSQDFVEVNVPVHTRQFAGHFLYQINKLNAISRDLAQ